MIDLFIALLSAVRLPGEEDVARRLREKDPKALETVFDFYGPLVYRLVLRMVRDPASSEDIVQDTFARLWDGAHRIGEDATHIGPWIFTIARNRALDFLRAQRSRTRFQEPLAENEPGFAVYQNADEALITEENARRVGQALRNLTANQRQVIELAYYGGLSQSEIAAHLKQPLGTVKSWTRTALMTLRAAITTQAQTGGQYEPA